MIGEEISKIENMIYEIRGKQVMLDSDVAMLFGYETKNINRQVQRNIKRFPDSYCFQLDESEFLNLRCQSVTSGSKNTYGGRRYLPYVFTEHGITMLAGILRSDIAIAMSLKIVDAFINMKKYISTNLIEQKYINDLVIKHDYSINILEKSFDKLRNDFECGGLFFEGQIYDSYSLLLDIFSKAEKEIIIIDNYIDKKILDVLRKADKSIVIYTNKYNNEDYEKYKIQYSNITLKIINSFHDRFIILDRKMLYHCGSSFKDLGKKCFAISKIDNIEWLEGLLNLLN